MNALAQSVRALLALGPCLFAGLAPNVADAQVFTGLTPGRPFVLPEMGATISHAPAAAISAPATIGRRRLSTPFNGWRLAGESDSRAWRVALTAAEARTSALFEIGYVAAASVVPEGSMLRLEINGRTLGDVQFAVPGGIRHASFEIPAGLLTTGVNIVRVSARTRHRVDCSVEATYELWTQLDPETTGFVLTGDSEGIAQVDDLAATRPDTLGEIPVRIVLGQQRLSPGAAGATIAAVEALALAAGFDHPNVDFGAPADGDGLNILVGPSASFDTGLLPLDFGAVEGPRLAVLPGTNERRPTLVVTGTNEGDVALATQALAAMRTKASAGIERQPRPSGGERIVLRDLGVTDEDYAGRLFRMPFEIVLPRDFMAADYARAELDLAGAYPSGLTAGAQLRIDVNGVDAASVDLKTTGETFTHKQIFFPLSRLRPGRNRITIVAALPEPSDVACDAATTPRRRFQLLSSSELVLPQLAHVVSLPDLRYTAQTGYPLADAQAVLLHVPSPDRATMGAAATLATRIAIVAGRPVPFTFSALPPPPGAGALVVAAGPAIADELWAAGGLDVQAIRAAWTQRAGNASALSTAARHAHVLRDDGVAACTPSLERMRAPDVDPDAAQAPVTAIGISGLVAAARAWLPFNVPADRKPDMRAASLIVGEGLSTAAATNAVIVVSASSAQELAQSVACLVDPRVWDGLSGEIATLPTGAERLTSTAAARTRFISTRGPSAGNLRLIAAGWLSLNPGWFTTLVAAAAGFLALCTYWLIGNVGRKA